MKGLRSFIVVVAASLLSVTLSAENEKEKDGYVTGSFETNTNVYLEDAVTMATVPDSRFGSNNYLKVDYYNKRFSA